MTHLKYYALRRILDCLVNEETCTLLEAMTAFNLFDYRFSLQKLEQGIIEVYPLSGNFYIIEFLGY